MREADRNKAIAEAKRRLLPLFIDIQSWDDPSAKSTGRAHQHAAALLEYPGPISDTARQNAIAALKHKSPPGRHKELNARRDRIIAETVEALQKQFGINQEEASEIVAKALEDIYEKRHQYLLHLGKQGAEPSWIRVCMEHIDNLKLSQRRILNIARRPQS